MLLGWKSSNQPVISPGGFAAAPSHVFSPVPAAVSGNQSQQQLFPSNAISSSAAKPFNPFFSPAANPNNPFL